VSDNEGADMDLLLRRFDRFEDEYAEFDQIPPDERLHPNRRLCAFLKIASLFEDVSRFDINAEHDTIYLSVPDDLTDDDILYLTRCGVGYDHDTDSLRLFV
jgi:hypothetical protein